MTATLPDDTAITASGGRIPDNIMHFARTLRAAGLPVGPGTVLEAIRAVSALGMSSRTDFYWALHAVFVNRRDQRDLFDQAFNIFWRNPKILERMMALMLPQMEMDSDPAKGETLAPRIAEALAKGGDDRSTPREEEELEFDAALPAKSFRRARGHAGDVTRGPTVRR